ncbi:methylated-DNA--[protein]-cysteine S-methyltransferase [Stakelama marina]|uniref:Methylated-DNA--[protein]-cysteine S-methyltransferase n=1 Tax=Stakelama marina TaxID=2826939 RepID=A0A8T4IKV5_9SPHN|nr:methylated-DNA--[protein]-cysteine S-methyltransferase [Stakelama marina]MBR0552989.1 methylated-DNA--[protein]-cysteine S-methyltransferase [Stakelama marina]
MYARDHGMIATPIGTIHVEGDDELLYAIRICDSEPGERRGSATMVRTAIEQIGAWFAGDRTRFDLALAPLSTRRGEQLRAGLIDVGYGETLSYGAFANILGSSARAIGQLCARNPFPIVVPCHRILAAGGVLGAYSAGTGPATKRWLLDHEQAHLSFNQTGDAA